MTLTDKLNLLYGERSHELAQRIDALVAKYRSEAVSPKPWVSENDVMLITYGDSILDENHPPLQTLADFLRTYAKGTVTAVHILPFYPYTSDDGFSVVDYRKVNPALGEWPDVKALAEEFDLMFDAVINHISKSSEWFQRYLQGEAPYTDYFIEADPSQDYSQVTRPRALPLLTPFASNSGIKHVWTTFSDDQIDLNFKNPDVLLEILDILLMYAVNGARYLRLDAIGFIWKKLGTSCMHLEETHAVVKIIREVLDRAAPGTIIITETNVPHRDNISYFGNGYDEAQLVYQFPLPPLIMFSFLTKNTRKLLEWADSLEPTTEQTTFFNFLSSHDGIGMRPTEGILSEAERQLMVDKTLEHGGRVSYKDNGDGTKSPYELNITYLDALCHPAESDETRVKKTLAAHTILLSMAGVPGIYLHSLLGSRNDYKGLEESGINRRINREKLQQRSLYAELESDTLRRAVFTRFSDLIRLRRRQSAFNPRAKQDVMFLDDRVFSLLRTNENTGQQILVLVNVSDDRVALETGWSGYDLIGKQPVEKSVELQPYQCVWIDAHK